VIARPILVLAPKLYGVVHNPQGFAQGHVDLAVGVGVGVILRVGYVGIVVGVLGIARLVGVGLGATIFGGSGGPSLNSL
jgi:hypothetical protein